MADNRGVAYIGPGKVEVRDIDVSALELRDGPGVHPANVGRQLPHGAILRILSTNICGSDQPSGVAKKFVLDPHGLIAGR